MKRSNCYRVNYHSFENWLDALGLMIIIPKAEFLPGSRKEKLTPGSDQLVEEQSGSTVQVDFVPVFTCSSLAVQKMMNLNQELIAGGIYRDLETVSRKHRLSSRVETIKFDTLLLGLFILIHESDHVRSLMLDARTLV